MDEQVSSLEEGTNGVLIDDDNNESAGLVANLRRRQERPFEAEPLLGDDMALESV